MYARELVLAYHAVAPGGDGRLTVAVAVFRRQVAWLRARGYRFCPPGEYFAGGPGRRVLLTFDDGSATSAQHAMAWLAMEKIPALVFIPPDDVRRGNLVAGMPLMTPDTVLALARTGYIHFGSHALTHRHLHDLSAREIACDLGAARAGVTALSGTACAWFCPPYGDYSPDIDAVARQYYQRLFITPTPREHALAADDFVVIRRGIYGNTGWLKFRVKMSVAEPRLRRCRRARG